MTSSNKDRYYTTVGKSRRSSPGDSQNSHGVFFQAEQGGRTVLPPLADSFPTSRFPVPASYSNPYTQPRSAPNKLGYDLNPQALCGTYQTTGASPQFPTGFPNYEMQHERYSPQPSFPAYASRSSTPNMVNPADSRRLPPLTTSSTPPIERWQQPSFIPQPTGFPGNSIRSPAASYPPAYVAYSTANQDNAYSYHMQPHDHVTSMNPQGHRFTIDGGFALCIGIDRYRLSTIRPLRGAVADARAVAGYLRQLKVPEDHITILENEAATRHAIIEGLQRLAKDPRIHNGNPIIIYYAGHGSEASAPEWEAGGPNANIQLTVPYDAYCESGGEVVAPIPDRTLGALLEAIAQQKGDNIFVIMDSCYSASGTRSFNNSSDSVRCIPLPSDFQFEGRLEADASSLPPTTGGPLSHVLLSACGSSEQAWEAHGRGVFTAALLDFLKDSQIDKLRYCDIVMRMDIDPRQIPHCEGFNRERYVFTTTSPPPTEYFIPLYTRISKNGPFVHVLNGGAAHGLFVGDEFNIYPDIDCQESLGILAIEEVGSFYSVAFPPLAGLQLATTSVAVRINKGKDGPLRIPTADFPEITTHVLVEMYELQQSQSRFPGSPTPELLSGVAVPYENGSFILKQGYSYGLKLTNNSAYDLYPTVNSSNLLKFNPWYRPPCSRSRLDVPLKKDGGSLTIGYGSGGSPALVIPSSPQEGHGSLDILLSTQPLHPLYNDKSFRVALYLPEALKGPWTTVSRRITFRLSETSSRLPPGNSPLEFLISNPTRPLTEPWVRRSLVPFQGHKKSVSFPGLAPDHQFTKHLDAVVQKPCVPRVEIK